MSDIPSLAIIFTVVVYVVTRWNTSLLKVGLVDVDIGVPSHLKKELAWAVDEQLRVISTIMLFKNSKSTKELKGTKPNLKQYHIYCYVALSYVF